MERWHNKVAVVTGASSGIGEACAKALLNNGMIVVGLARRHERMEKEFKANLPKDQQSRFHALKCDLCQEDDIVKSFKWIEDNLNGIDVLVNNAGKGFMNTQIVSENNAAELKTVLDLNVLGVAFCTREAFRSMKKRNLNGHVVIINSVAGHQYPSFQFNLNLYFPSKFAVTAMTEVLRQEFLLNETKIKVTSISPGLVKTEAIQEDVFPPNLPILKSEDVADAVVYCIQTPPHVQIHELTIRPVGETF